MNWNLDIIGIPESQGRPRVFFRNGRGMAYSPKTTWFQLVYTEAKLKRPAVPFDFPLRVETRFRFPRLKGTKKTALWKTTKPDADNLLKAILDALTQAGVWRDDSLVVSWSGEKTFAYGNETSGVSISIEPADVDYGYGGTK